MPLMKGRSKRAFEHNVEAEMKSGKPQNESLAIAYSVKRKAKKKAAGGSVQSGSPDMNYAEGGDIEYSARKGKDPLTKNAKIMTEGAYYSRRAGGEHAGMMKEEAKKHHKGRLESLKASPKPKLQGLAEGGSVKSQKRPMPDNAYNDAHSISRNSGNKLPHNDSWTDNSTIKQVQANNSRRVMPIKHPKMVPQNAYSVRLRDEEDDLQSSASPGRYDQQPPAHDNELDASSSGNDVPDMASQHSNGKKPYNKAIEDQYAQDMAEADMKRSSAYAQGGPVMEPKDHGIELMERDEEAHEQSALSPSKDEGASMAHHDNEEDPDRHGPAVSDMEDEHSTGRKPYAKGGDVQFKDAEANEDDDMELNPAHDKHSPDDSEDQLEPEEDQEHEDSIAAAIMSKKSRKPGKSSDSDIDDEMMLALGGEILHDADEPLSHGSMDSDDSDQADLRRNAQEDANEEDQASFNALRKENYSESAGLDALDSPMDSAQHGDSEESDSENEHDKIDKMRSRMKKRQFKQR